MGDAIVFTCSWRAFGVTEARAIEMCYCNPSETQWSGVVPPTAGYQFSGRVEVHFFMKKLMVRGRPVCDIRCLRTPSHVTLPAHRSASTQWQWYTLVVGCPGLDYWSLVPPPMDTQLELAHLEGDERLVVRDLSPSVLQQLPPNLIDLEINLKSLTGTTGRHELELARRPKSLCKPVVEHSMMSPQLWQQVGLSRDKSNECILQ